MLIPRPRMGSASAWITFASSAEIIRTRLTPSTGQRNDPLDRISTVWVITM